MLGLTEVSRVAMLDEFGATPNAATAQVLAGRSAFQSHLAQGFEAGLSIVIVAILLDRLCKQRSPGATLDSHPTIVVCDDEELIRWSLCQHLEGQAAAHEQGRQPAPVEDRVVVAQEFEQRDVEGDRLLADVSYVGHPNHDDAEPVARFQTVRAQSERLTESLAVEDFGVQPMDDASPPKWHLAHVSWLFETFILPRFNSGYENFDPHYDYLFNSYYETVGSMHPRPKRGMLSRPTIATVCDYCDNCSVNHHQTAG